jgi:hypothetical protein
MSNIQQNIVELCTDIWFCNTICWIWVCVKWPFFIGASLDGSGKNKKSSLEFVCRTIFSGIFYLFRNVIINQKKIEKIFFLKKLKIMMGLFHRNGKMLLFYCLKIFYYIQPWPPDVKKLKKMCGRRTQIWQAEKLITWLLSSGQDFDITFLDSKHVLKVYFKPSRKNQDFSFLPLPSKLASMKNGHLI